MSLSHAGTDVVNSWALARYRERDLGRGDDPREHVMTVKRDEGFTLIELLIVVAIISIIAAISVPGLLRARMTGNEVSALASLKVVNSSEVAYSASCGNNGFAIAFTVLGTPPPGTTVPFISPDLGVAAPQKSGYNYTMAAGAGAGVGPLDCNGTATQSAYYATAAPMTFGTTGSKAYATNAGNTVWQVSAAAAPTEPFGAPATPIQ
ncbi:MAG: prepilin-type N-terminal cleavage/methylation domain-containing protein [Acidobacteria bacterium]|jgi:type IV pilus assembly protein PilA|nr:prepilin-type N-terminal cleavage/methylation domain-containing protein [Acidobacteriota bacterium]